MAVVPHGPGEHIPAGVMAVVSAQNDTQASNMRCFVRHNSARCLVGLACAMHGRTVPYDVTPSGKNETSGSEEVAQPSRTVLLLCCLNIPTEHKAAVRP